MKNSKLQIKKAKAPICPRCKAEMYVFEDIALFGGQYHAYWECSCDFNDMQRNLEKFPPTKGIMKKREKYLKRKEDKKRCKKKDGGGASGEDFNPYDLNEVGKVTRTYRK